MINFPMLELKTDDDLPLLCGVKTKVCPTTVPSADVGSESGLCVAVQLPGDNEIFTTFPSVLEACAKDMTTAKTVFLQD